MASPTPFCANWPLLFCSLLLVTVLVACFQPKHAASGPPLPASVLEITPGTAIRYSPPWAPSENKYGNAHELVRRTRPGSNEARIMITTEQRLDLADAQRRLLAVARSRRGQLNFYSIGGWPAVEVRFQELLPIPDAQRSDYMGGPPPIVDRARVAVAADTSVVDFDIWLGPQVPRHILDEAVVIANSTTFQKQASPQETQRRIQELKQSSAASGAQSQSGSSLPTPGAGNQTGSHPDLSVTPNGPVQNLLNGTGELEIAASVNGQQIVVAAVGGSSFSKDGGTTFLPSTPPPFGTNDPTVTRGTSGNFYLGSIQRSASPPVCNDTVSRSTDGGATFTFVGASAQGTPIGQVTFPDQPHIAADTFRLSGQDKDQLYAVWRNQTPVCGTNCPESCFNLSAVAGAFTSMISCSQDNGVNWTLPPFVVPGGGDHPRVAAGADGSVYAITLDGSNALLTRFSSCASGLVPQPGYPVTVDPGDASVSCPIPGIDRCAGALTSQMVATDPLSAKHLFVTYARQFAGGEQIVSRESNDAGLTFAGEIFLSPLTGVRRFMPWPCSSMGSVFAGWYDRTAALKGPTNDLTDYLVGSPILSSPLNLTGIPDPQCGNDWPSGPIEKADAQSCTLPQPGAGVCMIGSKPSGARCDFNTNNCPSGQSCQTDGGQPKYGDYNGIACTSGSVIAAWSSATSPLGLPPLPPQTGITIFSRVIPLTKFGPATFDRLRIVITTGQDSIKDSSEVTVTVPGEGTFCLKPSTSNSPDGICANGSGATDQTGRNSWQNSDGPIAQVFTLPNPPDFLTGSMTITLVQGTCFGCTSDNWNIEDISAFAEDSTNTMKPLPLLGVLSGTTTVDDKSCIARLKDGADNAAAATFSLTSPPTNTHVYVGGKSAGNTTGCQNNGG